MKFIVGMDSFKGSLASSEANQSVKNGIESVYPEAMIKSFPMADGGEGTVETLIEGMNGEMVHTTVTGSLGNWVTSSFGLVKSEKLAIIEVASACGLPLLSEDELDPNITTTYGVGELINHAYDKGARTFIIGLGGSATNDGGVGMLQALGYQFKDIEDTEIEFGGGMLSEIHQIYNTEESDKFNSCEFRVACDVSNVLYGEQGATYVFGPQKGSDKNLLSALDQGMEHYSNMTLEHMNVDISMVEGGGAAGGLGAAFYGYLDGKLEPGIELVMDILKVEEEMHDATIVITGEGKLDSQTSMGKVPVGLAHLSSKYNLPVIAFGGSLTDDAHQLNKEGIDAIFSIQKSPTSIEEAMSTEIAKFNIKRAVEQVMKVLEISI